jgi:HEPN domain-containing protein
MLKVLSLASIGTSDNALRMTGDVISNQGGISAAILERGNMALQRSPIARRFHRAAGKRLTEAMFLLEHDFTTAAVYLAGYAVECSLKAVILAYEPVADNPATVETFRGGKAHSFDWLLFLLDKRHAHVPRFLSLPRFLSREFELLAEWSTELRYEPSDFENARARKIVKTAEDILEWAERSF